MARGRRTNHGTQGQGREAAASPVIALVNLGCAKNLVDSERVLGSLAEAGFLIAQEPADADLCLVNTCGFIREAREETAATLTELARLRETGRLKVLAALGCLVERVADVPAFGRFLDAADVRLGFKDYPRLPQLCRELLDAARDPGARPASAATRAEGYNDFLAAPRLRLGSPHTAFLKISEGCSNRCCFCAIPRMRGTQVSRPIEALVAEARALADGGAQEINLIAQDTTSYGMDLYGQPRLADLLRALLTVKGPRWLRLLYAYPKHLTAGVLDVLAGDERFCPYIDIPLQHIADPMLRAMGRGVTKAQTLELLDLIQRKLPGGAIRTAFIVGYPGETEEHFRELLAFVGEGRFAHAGVFLYSPEPLTAAAKLADSVPGPEKESRRDTLMLAQREVSRRRLLTQVGQTVDVMVDQRAAPRTCPDPGARAIGRTRLDAPEVDGVVYLRGRGTGSAPAGTVVRAVVRKGLDYDLVADICGT
jgi:ribosomal protein S12 methylthiotransferase